MKALEFVRTSLHCEHPRVWLSLLRTLAKGQPVSCASLAHALKMSLTEIEVALATFADIVYDDNGDVVACGLSLLPTPHAFTVCGNQLYTWCALDALMYPVALKKAVQVESRCPVTGSPIRLTASPTGVHHLFPDGVVVSIVMPAKQVGCCNVRSSFCSRVHFISSIEVATSWLSQHPDAMIVSIEKAWQFGFAVIQQRMNEALGR
jgi:Alkylmercury lyase./Helix-turn-helix domain of alkylmercury lyase.